MGMGYFRRLAESMIDESFNSGGQKARGRALNRAFTPIVAQPQGSQAGETAAAGGRLGRIRWPRENLRSQLAIALALVTIGCLYLPRRLSAPNVSQRLRPDPVPVPAPVSAASLPMTGSASARFTPVGAADSTRVARLLPASIARAQDRPTVEVAPIAQGYVQGAGAAQANALDQASAALARSASESEGPEGPSQIDPIYQSRAEAMPSEGAAGNLQDGRYVDALNPTIHKEFASRPPMEAVEEAQGRALSTPVPFQQGFTQFSSRPPMGDLTLLREEIVKARDSLSVQVDAGIDTGLSGSAAGGPGSLWPTFDPPHTTSGAHFWLEPPFPGGFNQLYSPGYQFGSTGGGRYRIHHGIDIGNPVGTPVLASASGVVVHAGPDNPALLGPYNDFYGNSVVIRMDRRLTTPLGEQDIYLLYGHLVSVDVEAGQWVGVGDYLGGVGMTGIAIGPHLHLEVRLGQNSYLHTVNPATWMRPATYTGTVVVRLLSANGRTWPNVRIAMYRFEENGVSWYRSIETYPEEESIGPDPAWGENGAISYIPAGSYRLLATVNGEEVSQDITVRDGEATFVEMRTLQ